jgi:2,4-dienoyl-CoA reductase-like NADH-dependent reductase (Old Yellow Enzyme family)/thioredoxin reductase
MEQEDQNNMQIDKTEKHERLSRRTFLSGTGGAALAMAASGMLSNRALSETSNTPSAGQATDNPPLPAKAAASNAAKPLQYPHLLSPIKIGNHILKNRMIGTPSSPHFDVGPDVYPSEALISYYGNKARQGASLIVVTQPFDIHVVNEEDVIKIGEINNEVNPGHAGGGGHTPTWDLANTGSQNLLSQLTENCHLHDSLVLWKHKLNMPEGYDVSPSEGATGPSFALGGGPVQSRKEIPEEKIQEFIENIVLQALLAKECGFDGMYVHMGYRGPLTARFLSKVTNRRTDKYGGSLENRARFCLELIDALKKRCGQDYLLWGAMSGEENTQKGGYTLEDGAEYAKLFTGHLDMLSLKGDGENAPTNFHTGPTPYLYMTEAYKKRGVKIPLLSDGGFTNFELAEEAIASGKTDVVGMARAFVTTPDLGLLAREGRNEDVVPCLRCNGCHGWGFFKPWTNLCAVNPLWGWESKQNTMFPPPKQKKKKVAVIGGGPAGLEAALIAAQRGHSVTLYEKTGNLGGNLKLIENVSFKWPQRDFKNYLVRQVNKAGVKVRLNTEADPAMIKKDGYDAVIVAVGGVPIVPDIPGIKDKKVMFLTEVFGKEMTLAKDVVILGGRETALDTAMHLGEKGHQVTVLEESKFLAPTANRVHFSTMFDEAWANHKTCKGIVQARCNGITAEGVTYMDADGKQQSVKAGSVVVAMGMKANTDLAYQFHEASNELHVAGDCKMPWDIQTSIRSAFSAASQL